MKLSDAVRDFQYRWVKYGLLVNRGNIRALSRMSGKSPATMDRWVRLLGLQDYARSLRYADNSLYRGLGLTGVRHVAVRHASDLVVVLAVVGILGIA